MVKLVDVWTPFGPVIAVVGVWSSVLNDSNFLVARVESPVPPVAAVNAWADTSRLRLVVMVAGIDQVRVVPVPDSVAFRVLAVAPNVVNAVPLSWRYWPLSRSWTCTWTRPTVPLATRAVPVMLNGVLFATTRPSMGVVIVVSGRVGGKVSVLKSKNATRPVFTPPFHMPSPPTNRPRGVASMALSPSKEFEPPVGFHSSERPSTGLRAAMWSRRTTWSPRP